MDSPDKLMPPDPANDTEVRLRETGETHMLNSLERGAAPPWQKNEVKGDFRIEDLLGRGKSGFVYSAYDLIARKQCALKVLGPLNSKDLYRNKLGFRRMTPFRHPNLMQVERIHILDKRVVFAVQHVAGETLWDAMREISNWEPQRAFEAIGKLLQDYAVGLATMHDAGLVHRDIKPTNLMVTPEGRGVIIDFGLVASGDTESDPSGMRMYLAGTPRYFSPEAVWDQYYAPPGDLFALGLVMLECINKITGHNGWFRTADFKDWQREQDQKQIEEAMAGLTDQVPDTLRKAVVGMLRPNRLQRFTATQVALLDRDRPVSIPWVTQKKLFGRTRELNGIQRWLDSILHGKSGRLHIHGPSGIGKTRLLDEIEQTIQQSPWCQVFRVKCRSRERYSFQVMDQIADQIASRYSRGDREKLIIDSVSASILVTIFPQLRHVVKSDLSVTSPAIPDNPGRVDALAAATELSLALRKIGPIFIIVDDAQWSDHDTDTVWDQLQDDRHGNLGIVTVSRESETNQRKKADMKVHLRPLTVEQGSALLKDAASQWDVYVNTAARKELSELTGGIPYRLQELAEEFRPDGLLHNLAPSVDSTIANVQHIDRLWHHRFKRLSSEARQLLPFVVAAERPVSFEQLAALTGLGDLVDAAVSELVLQRLVLDDATGGECIRIVHDKVADGMFAKLSERERIDAHSDWANFLIRTEGGNQYASRIARHLFDAKKPSEALPYAIVAAKQADKIYAKSEAGTWHEEILKHVTGEVRTKHLRDAARCFHDADLPQRAAQYYLTLAREASDEDQRFEYFILATEVLLRSGQFEQAKPHIHSLCDRLFISLKPRLSDLANSPLSRIARLAPTLCQNGLSTSRKEREIKIDLASPATTASLDEKRLASCWAFARPLTLFDLPSMVRLLLVGSETACRIGTLAQRAYFSSAAVACLALSKGNAKGNAKARQLMAKLRKDMMLSGDHHAIAEVWASEAYVETMAMKWDGVTEPVSQSVAHYCQLDQPCRFEIAHVRWLGFWSDWHLGNWSHLVTVSDEMLDDSLRRHDEFQHLLSTSGFGGNAPLITNDLDRLRQAQEKHCDGKEFGSRPLEVVDFLRWIGCVQSLIYSGNHADAWRLYETWQQHYKRSNLVRIPAISVAVDFSSALIALHLNSPSSKSSVEERTSGAQTCDPGPPGTASLQSHIRHVIKRLRRRDSVFASMLSALLSGISMRQEGRERQAAMAYSRALSLATQLGLAPYVAAAQDGLDHAEDRKWSHKLRNQMKNDNVHQPSMLERLYTVAPPE